jgi:transcriptional regulator with XRE-family HTH domain
MSSQQPRRLRPRQSLKAVSVGPEVSEDGEFVGGTIRELRKARDLTISDLSEISGVSLGHLSTLERGKSKPSVSVLQSVARALGVTVSWFFKERSPELSEEREIVVRASSRKKLVFDSGISDELLSPHLRGELELLLCRFAPGAESGDKPYTHRGEEAGVVMEGSLALWVDGKEMLLNKGDSFTFESSKPHRYWNPGDEDAVVIWAITPPSY